MKKKGIQATLDNLKKHDKKKWGEVTIALYRNTKLLEKELEETNSAKPVIDEKYTDSQKTLMDSAPKPSTEYQKEKEAIFIKYSAKDVQGNPINTVNNGVSYINLAKENVEVGAAELKKLDEKYKEELEKLSEDIIVFNNEFSGKMKEIDIKFKKEIEIYKEQWAVFQEILEKDIESDLIKISLDTLTKYTGGDVDVELIKELEFMISD